MSRGGGAAPKTQPTGWVFCTRAGADGITVRWQRGETMAYILDGQRIGDYTTVAGILDTIPVAAKGWTDLAEVRLLGKRWLRQQ